LSFVIIDVIAVTIAVAVVVAFSVVVIVFTVAVIFVVVFAAVAIALPGLCHAFSPSPPDVPSTLIVVVITLQ
jgi:hypothetical protein